MISNIWTRLKSIVILIVALMFPFLFACASNITAKEEPVLPLNVWQVSDHRQSRWLNKLWTAQSGMFKRFSDHHSVVSQPQPSLNSESCSMR